MEIMIVIAIIGLLSAIAIPNLVRAKNKTKIENIFLLSDGTKVNCKEFYIDEGTSTLKNCDNGNEYYNQTNVTKVRNAKRYND